MSDQSVRADLIFGSVMLRPGQLVVDEHGRGGRQYERIDYDKNGLVKCRKTLEPVCWLSWD